ncbi:MAG: glycosyltransferase family 1 protein [Chloroflexi bacterium]|nr:glycosyltransferase family 1 protein [Chloroflexota bacterium]
MTAQGLDHVCISSIDWGYLWQGPQEVMTRLSHAGGRVVYVDHMGVRAPYLEDWRRIVARAIAWIRAPRGRPIGRSAQDRIFVISPVVLPFPWSRVARAVNRAVFARRLPLRARALGLGDPVVWSFVPTPVAVDAVRAFRGRRVCSVYYCVADFEEVTDRPSEMRRSEDEMLKEVDVVFAGGRVLQRRLAQRHPRVVLAPFSVGDGFFGAPHPLPADLGAIPGPRVGYVGGLHSHVDVELLHEVVRAMPAVQFVFIGPKVSGDWPIEREPNAHFVGRRSYGDLPAYIDGFDVCLIPYRRSAFTETVWPTKLHEYLARDKPVVSTSLPEVRLLGYPDAAVRVADDPSGMAAAIRAAIAERGAAVDRRALAERYSWARTLEHMTSQIDRAIEARGG